MSKKATREALGATLVELANEGVDVVAVDGDALDVAEHRRRLYTGAMPHAALALAEAGVGDEDLGVVAAADEDLAAVHQIVVDRLGADW